MQKTEMGLVDLSVAYIESMMVKGRRDETLRAHSLDVAALLGVVGDVRPEEVTSADVMGLLDQLAVEGKSIAAIIRVRDVIKAFFAWLKAIGQAVSNPADMDQSYRAPGRIQRISGPTLDAVQVSDIIGHLWSPEDRLFAGLMTETGLTASEVAALAVSNVRFVDNHHPEMPGGIAVLEGPKRIVIVAEPSIVFALQKQAEKGEGALFDVSRRTMQQRVQGAAREAGYAGVTLRDLRQAHVAMMPQYN